MKTKAIVAIMVTMLLAGTAFYVLPARAQYVLKVGVIGPMGWPQFVGMQCGAELAASWINDMGAGGGQGIVIGGNTYTVSLSYGDEHAADMRPDLAALEMERLITEEDCDIIYGGFRTECTMPMREVAADYDQPYTICGAATNELIDCGLVGCGACVRCDYDRYKYTFRTTPINVTMLVKNILGFLSGYVLPYRLAPLYGDPVKTAVLAEDLDWTIGLYNAFYYAGYLGPQADIVYGARTAYTPGQTYDFTGDLDAMHAEGVRLIVHIYSAPDTIGLVTQMAAHPIKAVLAGIDVVGQTTDFWTWTGGACQHEAFLHSSGTRSPISTTSQPWSTIEVWDRYFTAFGHAPIYTMWGVYDSLIALHDMLEGGTITPPFDASEKNTLVTLTEATDREGVLGRFKYTQNHDPFSTEYGATWDDRYVRSFWTQWQAGRHEVVWPSQVDFAKLWALPDGTGSMYPYTMDVLQDGPIDIFDALTIRAAFGTQPSPPDEPPDALWQYVADVNNNNDIEVLDALAVRANYGKSVALPLTYCDEAGKLS